MSAGERNYYNLLGLPPSATTEQIKKRYRELARRYHPDVNHSPDAGNQIKAINEAYHVLGDAERRAAYDVEQVNREMMRQSAAHAHSAGSQRSPQPEEAPHPRTAEGRAGFDGFGRTAPDDAREAAAGRARAESAGHRRSPWQAGVDPRLSEAQMAFFARRYDEAATICIAITKRDPRNAIAHEIMGDIFALRGHNREAIGAYRCAVRANSRNQSARGKLDRLLSRESAGEAESPSRPARRERRAVAGNLLAGLSSEIVVLVLSVLLVAAFGAVTLFVLQDRGVPQTSFPWLLALSPGLICACVANGVIAGILLSFYGGVRPLSQELTFGLPVSRDEQGPPPLGTVLTLLALVWFYISFAAYLIIAAVRNRFSPSLLRAFGLALLLVVLFACVYHPAGAPLASLYAAAFSGNALFPALLAGWSLGDALRYKALSRL